MRIYYPAFSYLERYLPAVYREDPVSASFLDRYLANVEGLLTSFEGRVAAAEGLFDPRISPPEYLDWLAGWFGTALDADWDDTRRRLFLAYAELLYRWRGTPAGLLAMIRLAIEPCPSEEIFADLLAGRLPAETAYAGGSVRLVETFLTRTFGGVTLGDPSTPEAPGAAQSSEWTPSQGAEPLHQRFRDFLAAKYAPGEPPANALPAVNAAWAPATPFASLSQIRLSPVLPAQPAKAADWLAFLGAGLGFHYAAIDSSYTGFYRKFLERRWGRVEVMAAAYQLAAGAVPASFSTVQLPNENDFPSGGPRLFDWISFASLAAPIRDNAHRFTVLIPSSPSESAAQRNRRIEVVQAVVGREKPAHTDFEIKPFWALFQAGSARLGLDTALGEGARFTAIELGRTALGEGFLAHGHPWNVMDRAVLGRDAVAEVRP
jgi:phage tail-like protein